MNEERRENGQRGCGGGAGILYYNMRRGTIMISTMLHVDQGAAVGLSQELRMYSEATGGRVAKRASTLLHHTSHHPRTGGRVWRMITLHVRYCVPVTSLLLAGRGWIVPPPSSSVEALDVEWLNRASPTPPLGPIRERFWKSSRLERLEHTPPEALGIVSRGPRAVSIILPSPFQIAVSTPPTPPRTRLWSLRRNGAWCP